MQGFESYNKFKNEIKELKQIYDFTFHLYLQENKLIEEQLKHKKTSVVSVNTSINFITHSLDSLYQNTKGKFPLKLRQLILINSITALEVFFTDIIKEISTRNIEPFKTNERVEFQRNHLLNFPTLKGIELDLLNKDIRKITSGGLSESKKYFLQRFQIDFDNIGLDFNEIQEIHERRHLQVHRNGICDIQYTTKYSQFGYRPGQHIKIEHPYIVKSLDLLLDFGRLISEKALIEYPNSLRKTKNYKGIRVIDKDDIKLLIEYEILTNNYSLQSELLDLQIDDTNGFFKDYVIQTTIKEKKYNIYVSAPERIISKLMQFIKHSEKIHLLNISQIEF
jgi:hypothetical protein